MAKSCFPRNLGSTILSLSAVFLLAAASTEGKAPPMSAKRAKDIQTCKSDHEKAESLYEKGEYESALPLYEEAARLKEAIVNYDNKNLELAGYRRDYANCSYMLQKYAQSADLYRKAIDAFRPTKSCTTEFATLLTNYANCVYSDNCADTSFEETLKTYGEALALRKKLLPADSEDITYCMEQIGLCYVYKNQPAKAEPLLELALTRRKIGEKGKTDTQLLKEATENLANCLYREGKYPRSLALYKDTILLQRQLKAPIEEISDNRDRVSEITDLLTVRPEFAHDGRVIEQGHGNTMVKKNDPTFPLLMLGAAFMFPLITLLFRFADSKNPAEH